MNIDLFFIWFFYGLGGIGGWLIFLLLALIAVIWLLYDSARRRIPALGWKVGIIVGALLIIPTVLFRFGAVAALLPYSQPMFYLGLLGGILPVVLAIGYYVAYEGMVGCPYGHVYEAVLGTCPYDSIPDAGGGRLAGDGGTDFGTDVLNGGERFAGGTSQTGLGVAEMEPPKPKAPAWLVTHDGREHQLNKGVTMIGRSARNDIVIDEQTVGREHAKIVEDNGVFRLHDLGSANHTYVNDERLEKAVILEADDRIGFGRNAVVKFVYTRR